MPELIFDLTTATWAYGGVSIPVVPSGGGPGPGDPSNPSFPNRATTGIVSAGNPALTNFPAGTYSTSGSTLLNREVNGDLAVTGSNVTIRGCRINGQLKIRGGNNVIIEDCDVNGLIFDGATNFRATRIYTLGQLGVDGAQIKADGGYGVPADGVIEWSFIGNPVVNATSHYDSFQFRGANRITLAHNTIDHGVAGSDRYNAAVFLENANGGNFDIVIENNYIRARGFFALKLTGSSIVRNNVFAPEEGGWGDPITNSSTGYTSLNNLFDGGGVAIPDTP